MGRDARHEAGLKLFEAHQFEQAARELRASLELNPTSETWNDWAVAEAACGRTAEAVTGLSNALSLDPVNPMALENLRHLRDAVPRVPIFNIIQDSSSPSGSSKQTRQPDFDNSGWDGTSLDTAVLEIVNSYFQALTVLPAQDPALSPEMRDAFQWLKSNSSYFVKEAYRRLLELPEPAVGPILARLELQAERDYRFLTVAALHAMDQRQWDRALSLLRSAADRSWADLFVQQARILCDHLRHNAEPDKPDTFVGLEDYLATRFCPAPWENMEITSWGTEPEQTGDVYFCCPSWLPLKVGNAREQSVEAILTSPVAQEVRKSILDGSFRYCSRIHCNLISGRLLPSREAVLTSSSAKSNPASGKLTVEQLYPADMIKGPLEVTLSYDRSCNLACPSCRTDYYIAPKKQQEELQRFYDESVKNVVKDARLIYMDGAGEAFFSKHSREVLKSLNRQDYPALKFRFLTNGQLLDRRTYEHFDLRGRLERVDISIDAARPETFAVIRKGGTLSRLLENLEFLDRLRQQEDEKFMLTFRYVVSALNYKEIPEVIRLARWFHLDMVEFAVIRQWGHFSPEEARRMFVFNPAHPEYLAFVAVLSAPELDDPIVNLGSVLEFRKPIPSSSRPISSV